MKLVVTVDTEEDQWGQFDCARYTTLNARRIPEFQSLCDQWSVRPTYLVSYEMARQDSSAEILSRIATGGSVEIGAHCHPWNTPPAGSPATAHSSMLCNLPAEVQFAKLETLTTSLEQRFGTRPVSFRAGRWGLGESTATQLLRLGYQVDSSVTPFMSWADEGGPDYSRAYPDEFWLRLSADGGSRLLEIPATVGYLQDNAQVASAILNSILKSSLLRGLGVYGILSRLRLLNRVWICPEMTPVKRMIQLTRRLIARKVSIVNLMFHSVTLEPGLSPFVRSEEEATRFNRRLKEYFAFCREEGLEPALLREFAGGKNANVPVSAL